MFENVKVKGIHATRYIMSYIRMGGNLNKRAGQSEFENWLKSLGLNEDEIYSITSISSNGKMELEMSAAKFIETMKNSKEEERA